MSDCYSPFHHSDASLHLISEGEQGERREREEWDIGGGAERDIGRVGAMEQVYVILSIPARIVARRILNDAPWETPRE